MGRKRGTENKAVEIPILNHEYVAVVCWGDGKFIHKTLRTYGITDIPLEKDYFENREGVTFSNPVCHPIIALPRCPKTPYEIGTLAHEACHAVEHILKRIGQEVGSEILAHSVGAIVGYTLKANERKPTK